MNQTLLHPFIAVIFFATGCLSYLIYEFFRSFAKNNIIDALLDIIAAVINSALFVTVTHFFYFGQLKLHTLISYLTGFVALRFLFAQSIKSFFKRLNEALEKLISFMNKKVQKLQAKFKGVLLKNERGTRKQTTKHGNEPRKQSAKHNKIKKGAQRGVFLRRNSSGRAGATGSIARNIQNSHRGNAEHRDNSSHGKRQSVKKYTFSTI